jgi:hypothetical protein
MLENMASALSCLRNLIFRLKVMLLLIYGIFAISVSY